MKYLVVDDHAKFRTVLKSLLCGPNDQWRECINGSEAMLAFTEFQPDWILMDISMPGLDGLAATSLITAAHPHARVIIVTQHCGLEYEQAARDAGACDLVNKGDLPRLQQVLSSPQTPIHRVV